MPRSGTGVYTLPVAPFTPNTIIKSADVNSDFSDIGAAITLSLATTGVSVMTGQIKAFAGSQTAPGYAFASALQTGWFLSGTNEMSWVAAGVVGAIFGASTTVTWSGNVIYSGGLTVNGSMTVGSNLTVTGSLSTVGNANFANGAVIVATTSVDIEVPITLFKQSADPTSVAVSKVALYVKADGFGTAPKPYFEGNDLVPVPLMFTGGQCQLTKSGAALLLSPYQGNRLTVNGVPCIIPDAGVQLAASNSAGIFVYIYAVASVGFVSALEMSTTVPVAQAGTGVKQKTGDATRTLVGAAYTDTAGAWADTNGKLWVLSYFNRRRKPSRTTITASTSITSTAYVEVDTAMRNQFITWSDEFVPVNSKLFGTQNGFNSWYSLLELDGTTALDSALTAAQALLNMSPNYSIISGVTENTTHYATIYTRTTAGAVVCSVGASSGEGTTLYIAVNG